MSFIVPGVGNAFTKIEDSAKWLNLVEGAKSEQECEYKDYKEFSGVLYALFCLALQVRKKGFPVDKKKMAERENGKSKSKNDMLVLPGWFAEPEQFPHKTGSPAWKNIKNHSRNQNDEKREKKPETGKHPPTKRSFHRMSLFIH